MNEDSKKFRNRYGNLYKSNGGPELVTEEELKKALRLRENRTDTILSEEEIKKIRRKLNIQENVNNKEEKKAREEFVRRKSQAKRARNDRERDD